MHEQLQFIRNVRNLSYINRCSNTPHIKEQSVAEHSFFVALYSMLIADLENIRIMNESKEEIYDTSEVLKMAILHDVEESITGDILYPIKNENKEIKPLLEEAIERIVNNELFKGMDNLLLEKHYKKLWKKSNLKESRLVRAVDKFELLIYAVGELELGNTNMLEMYHHVLEILKTNFKEIITLQKLIETIEEHL